MNGEAVWGNIGRNSLREVKDFPLKSWDRFSQAKDTGYNRSYKMEKNLKEPERAGDKFLLGSGISIYEKFIYQRCENTWADIYENRDELYKLLDILVDMNLYAIERYAEEGLTDTSSAMIGNSAGPAYDTAGYLEDLEAQV